MGYDIYDAFADVSGRVREGEDLEDAIIKDLPNNKFSVIDLLSHIIKRYSDKNELYPIEVVHLLMNYLGYTDVDIHCTHGNVRMKVDHYSEEE